MREDKIDIVVTWVDGNDPVWQAERAKYHPNNGDNSATKNRFRDWGLMRYWFRGVEKYAPWVNNVYFVTCGHYPDWLNANHPKLKLVKHSDYIPADILPTFNSNTIEMYLNRLEGLSEKFVLFNDDAFFISDTTKEDFFDGELPCESALLGVISSQNIKDVFPHIVLNNSAIINKHFSKKAVMAKHKSKFFSPRYGKNMVRNISLLPFVYFSDFRDLHLPSSHLKSNFDEVWKAEPEALYDGTKSRFRSMNDINHWLIKDWYLCKGEFSPRRTDWGNRFELGVDRGVFDYITNHKGKVVCLNDSDDSIDFESIQKELKESFEKILPEKSQFEK